MDRPPRHSHGILAAILLRTQPDDQLVSLSRSGGAAAFEEIARRHGPALTLFAASVAPASQADDVVQDALIKAHAALCDGAEPEVLTAWLFRIVRNTAIDARRSTRTHEELDENHDGVEQPPQALERRAQVAALLTALNELPRSQREAIVQREFEGRGHEEIALSLGQSTGAVRQLIYRARNSLRQAIGGLIPPALVRLATMPGASEVAGGTGLAAAVKLGLVAIVATGTIVAGSSIGKGSAPPSAQAQQLAQAGPESTARPKGTSGSHPDGERRKPGGSDRPTGSSPGQSAPGGEPSATGTPGAGSGQGGDAGSGSGSDSGSGEREPGSGSSPGSGSEPGSEPGPTGGSTGSGTGGEPAPPGSDGTGTPPPPSDPPPVGDGDGPRI